MVALQSFIILSVSINFGGKSREESSRSVLNPQKKKKNKNLPWKHKLNSVFISSITLTTCLAEVSNVMSFTSNYANADTSTTAGCFLPFHVCISVVRC